VLQGCDMTKRSKKAWTKWRRLVSEQARSGQTVTAFCREHAMCRSYFFGWKKRLQESAATKFLEVQVTERVLGTPGDAGVEIRLQNGRSLMVRPGFDAEHVRALLALVEAAG
jgi:transposase-like protein